MKPNGRIVAWRLQCVLVLLVVALAGGSADPVEPEFDPREILLTVYHTMGGPEWTNSDSWATDAPFEDSRMAGRRSDVRRQVF